MKVLNLELNKPLEIDDNLCACIGYFDGFHKGHQGLFNATLKAKEKYNYKSTLITFEPDPWVVIKNIENVEHIMSMDDRLDAAEKLGFDYFIILNFTKAMCDLDPIDFINKLLVPINIKYLVCGFDFHFGTKGLGNVDYLRVINKFEVEEIAEIMYDNEKISSTCITDYIESGKIELANILLTRPFSIRGTVIHGASLGKTYGFPTANLELIDSYIKPKQGVYAGKALVNEQPYLCMINVGHNPTFNLRDKLSIEVNILDFDADIYGEQIVVEFHKFLRNEEKLRNIEELVSKLEVNALEVRKYFSNI